MAGEPTRGGPDPSLPQGERRASPRYPAAVKRCWLGWSERGAFQSTPARLIDISTGGCLIVTETAPPFDRTVLIRLDGPLLPVWFELKTLEIRLQYSGISLVAMTFPDSCPYELFLAVVYGVVSTQSAQRQPELPSFFTENRLPAPRGPFSSRSWSK